MNIFKRFKRSKKKILLLGSIRISLPLPQGESSEIKPIGVVAEGYSYESSLIRQYWQLLEVGSHQDALSRIQELTDTENDWIDDWFSKFPDEPEDMDL